jgi:hypothetical protein
VCLITRAKHALLRGKVVFIEYSQSAAKPLNGRTCHIYFPEGSCVQRREL